MLSAACLYCFFVDVFVVDLSFKDVTAIMMTQGEWSNKYGKADGSTNNPDMGAAAVLTSHCPHACI